MRKLTAAAGSAVFLVIAPGVVAGLVPWWLTGWRTGSPYPGPVRAVGAVVASAGAAVLIYAFTQFVIDGAGTPAPPAPTERLVVSGLYRYVRKPPATFPSARIYRPQSVHKRWGGRLG